MSYDTNMTNNDEYDVTAVQIFDLCGVEGCGAIRVDALMDKFAPFVKTDKAEFTYLRTLLDPEQCNPEINVTKLATALHKYSEKKTKVDLDESFNVRGGQMPLDSDSGISSDGLQLMEELQCELKEKEHLYNQLRRRLDSAERQHEEAMAALSAERDSLQTHVNVIRDENAQLSQVRHEYEEVCERLCAVEAAMTTHARANDTLKRRNNLLTEQIAGLEADKLTLQELLSKSKDECHRINEMYATRQSALLEENETLRSSHGEVSSRLQDHEEFMHQLIKEKAQLEMELKDLLNKSNQTHLRLDRSIDVSYTDDQMLTALDSLNADSRFIPDQTSVGTQVETPCGECDKRKMSAPQRMRRLLWEPLKSLLQLFAVVCFVCACCVVCGLARARGCARRLPWGWLHAQDVLDLLLRVEYTSDVPM